MFRIIAQSKPNPIFSHPYSNVLCAQEGLCREVPRVLILYSGILLDDLIASLLCEIPDLHICATPIDHEGAIVERIVSERPQSVIFCESSWFSVEKLSRLLEDFHYSEAIQIIVVSRTESSVEINNKEKVTIQNSESFVNLIKNNGFSLDIPGSSSVRGDFYAGGTMD